MTWYNSSWLKRKPVTIDQTQVDATLTDFPVMVDLANSDVLASARADMRDVLFTSSDGTTKLSHELVKRTVVGVGAWSWFSNPRAIYDSGSDKTFVSSISTGGSLIVTEYNHTSAAITQTTLTASLEVDDHDHASLMVRGSDSKLVAFYAKHSTDATLRYKISTNATDSTAWGSEQTTTFSGVISYANPIVLADDSSACYVFTRVYETAGNYRWSYKRTTDYSTWGSEVELWDPGATQSYLVCEVNGTGRIDFFASDGHPSTNGNTSLYHFYAAWDSGSSTLKYYNSVGTEQTLPIDTSKATLIYDGSGGQDGWVHDIIIDNDGYPRVLYQQRVSATGSGDIRIKFSRWNGSVWTSPVEITASGGYVYAAEPAYCGVSCFDGADYNTVYLGKQVSSIYEMQAWATTDNGATWAKITDITSSSTLGPNFRPVSPRNHTGRLACLWASGIYTTYINYRMNIHCYPPIIKEAYVKVPSVSGTVNTDIYCYYDNQAAADQEDAVNAWDSNFMAVYHLEERPAVATVLDSTTNARTGTKKAMIEPAYLGNLNFGNKSGQSFDGVDDYISLPTSINFASLTEVTVEVVGSYDGSGSSGDEHQFFSNWSATAASIMIRAEPTAGGNTLEVFAIKATDTQVGGGIGATLSINTLHHIGAVYDATNLRTYINGTVGPTTYATGAAFDATASIAAYLGNTPHVATEQLTGYEEEVRISNVARSAAWLKATSVNLRTPTSFYTYGTEEDAPSAIDYSLTCAAGAYTYSGISAALPVSRSLSCASGSYTYSGVAATLAVRHGLSCDAGSYTYAGVATTLTYTPGDGTVDYVLTCAAGVYAYTGQSATLSVKHGLVCAAGAYSYSGESVSLQIERTLTCSAGAYIYAGQNATLSVKRSLACATGSYDYIGNTATLDYLSGAASINYVLICAAGAYAYAGQSATLTVVSSWAGEPFNFASPITMTFNFASPI